MKTYKEMADDALNRISQYETEKQNKRKRTIRIATSVVSCCLVAAVCIGMWQGGTLKDRAKLADPTIGTGEKTYTPEEIEAQNQREKQLEQEYEKQQKELENSELENSKQSNGNTDEQIIISDNDDIKGSEASSMGFCAFWWKNKISMYGDLYQAINDNPDGTFAVTAKYRPTPEKVTGFTYDGKTLFQLAVAADNERMMPDKMTELLKVGDELKYGTALYETGNQDGVKWAKELYEEKLAYFGKDLLNKYIVNGAFLSDQLKNDIEAYNETSAARTYKLAYKAYLEAVLGETEKILMENNIKCERAPYSTDSLNIVVTADELENLPLEHIEFWVFGLTNKNLKSSQPANDMGIVL